jgi:acetolactate synthase-1/2/3 large subunit
MKVSEYVAGFLADLSKRGSPYAPALAHRTRVYMVCGAGAMHLNDSICHHPGIDVMAFHHEQAATFAAEADARVTNDIAVVHVTAGPGGTNTVTGLACAYVDSIPLLVIAGQVTSHTMVKHTGCRQLGMNELDMVSIVQPVTKYAITVLEPFMIRYHLERAVSAAMSGRRGPVWVEIPLDVQAAEIDSERLTGFNDAEVAVIGNTTYLREKAAEVVAMLDRAERPLLLIGNGVRLAGACSEMRELVQRLGIPVVSSWNASDIIPTDHGCYIGRCGIFGDRMSNSAVQNADLILAIGTRLSVAQIGHHANLFAPKAKKIIVDIDRNESDKPTVRADLVVTADARDFLVRLLERAVPRLEEFWFDKPCPVGRWVDTPAGAGVDAYRFVELLNEHLDDGAIVVTDVGFSFIPAMQRLRLKEGQRLFHSSGVSPMGWGLPAAIGACRAAPSRQIICLTGDGGLMMNLQELQTIAHHRLPISIFVFANDGYATMRIAQNNHFGRESVAGVKSGLSIPDLVDLAEGFGLFCKVLPSAESLSWWAAWDVLPEFVILEMAPGQVIAPRVQSRTRDGKFIPTPLDDMWPYPTESESLHKEPVHG